jgi:hypothetical protein
MNAFSIIPTTWIWQRLTTWQGRVVLLVFDWNCILVRPFWTYCCSRPHKASVFLLAICCPSAHSQAKGVSYKRAKWAGLTSGMTDKSELAFSELPKPPSCSRSAWKLSERESRFGKRLTAVNSLWMIAGCFRTFLWTVFPKLAQCQG